MFDVVLNRSVGFVELLGKLSLGRWSVIRKGNGNTGLTDQIADKAVMCIRAEPG